MGYLNEEDKKNHDSDLRVGSIIICFAILFAAFLAAEVFLLSKEKAVTYTDPCSVSRPLKSRNTLNGEIITIDGYEIMRISTVTAYPDGYTSIIYYLDNIPDVVSEDIELDGKTGTYFRVPAYEGNAESIDTIDVDNDDASRGYVLLNDTEGNHEYIIGTCLNKEQLVAAFGYIKFPVK